MDAKMIIAIAVVGVVVIGGGAGIALMMNNDSGNSGWDTVQYDKSIDGASYKYGVYTGTARLQIYGNVNNDDYLNAADLTALKKIVENKNWNRFLNPLADVNCDGEVNQKDVDHLQDLLDKKDGSLMYYVNYNGYPDYIHYPITGKIGVNYEYGYEICQTFGIWDRVVAGIDRWVDPAKVSDARFPGVYDLYNMGTEQSAEATLAAYDKVGVTCVIGGSNTKINNQLHNDGWRIDYINLALAQQRLANITPITAVLTCGVLLGCEEKCKEFIDYYDATVAEIENVFKNSGLPTYSFIVPYNTASDTVTDVDCIKYNGNCMGDYWNIMQNLPCQDAWTPQDTNCIRDVEIETLIATNPDLIFISMWGVMTDKTSAADAQASFEEKAYHFRESDAYKNGNVYGFAFETTGTYAGICSMKLLASYIWPDLFSEEEGWADMQYYYDNFTEYKGDLKNAGGLIVFKLSETTA